MRQLTLQQIPQNVTQDTKVKYLLKTTQVMDLNTTRDKSFGQKLTKPQGQRLPNLVEHTQWCFVCQMPAIELKDIIFVSLDSHHTFVLFLLSAPPLFSFGMRMFILNQEIRDFFQCHNNSQLKYALSSRGDTEFGLSNNIGTVKMTKLFERLNLSGIVRQTRTVEITEFYGLK